MPKMSEYKVNIEYRVSRAWLVMPLLQVLGFIGRAISPRLCYACANALLRLVVVEMRVAGGQWQRIPNCAFTIHFDEVR